MTAYFNKIKFKKIIIILTWQDSLVFEQRIWLTPIYIRVTKGQFKTNPFGVCPKVGKYIYIYMCVCVFRVTEKTN